MWQRRWWYVSRRLPLIPSPLRLNILLRGRWKNWKLREGWYRCLLMLILFWDWVVSFLFSMKLIKVSVLLFWSFISCFIFMFEQLRWFFPSLFTCLFFRIVVVESGRSKLLNSFRPRITAWEWPACVGFLWEESRKPSMNFLCRKKSLENSPVRRNRSYLRSNYKDSKKKIVKRNINSNLMNVARHTNI